MSWALEEWKEGLPWRVLQKVQELEGQLDKLKKERQQRQFQLESLEAALQKQKQKVESERSEGVSLKRENQSLVEACEGLERAKQKMAHELQLKETQLSFQEGQLSSGKKQIERLEQELKRCRAELERTQVATPSAESAPSNQAATPQKGLLVPVTPSHCSGGSDYEELKEKYNKEVEERRRLEAEVKAWQAKRASPPMPQSTRTHRDIARHQASSSVFWQQDWTPSRLCLGAQSTPGRRQSSAGEQAGTPSRLRSGQRDTVSSCGDCSSGSHLLDQLRAQNQELRSQASELQLRLQAQEKEARSQGGRLQELQLQRDRARAELADSEKALGRSRDELARVSAQHEQAVTKCSELEQKLKKLVEDLSCQRQNAESARCSWEQRSKEREKELQEELCRQQRALQGLEQERAQTQARLSQELQQAKHAHGALQAELDQVTSVKLQLEKSLEESKRKLCRAEQASQASELKESELRRESEELRKESQQLAAQVRHLQEELGRAERSCCQRQSLEEELRAKIESQESLLLNLQEKLDKQENPVELEELRRARADLEQQRDGCQHLLREREQHLEQLSGQLSRVEQELEGQRQVLEAQQREQEQLAAERAALALWKSEKEPELQQLDAERGALQDQLRHLEAGLRAQQLESHEYRERVSTLELDRENLQAEIRGLRCSLDSRSAEAEAQQRVSEEARREAEVVAQKLREEAENQCSEVARLSGQVADLEQQLGALASEIRNKDQAYQDLLADCESLQAQLWAKDAASVPDRSLLEPVVPSSTFADGKGEGGSPRALDSGHCHVPAPLSHPDFASLQSRVAWLESALECQKQENSDLQRRCEQLVQLRGEAEENLAQAQRLHQSLVAETSQRLSELQEDASVCQTAATGAVAALENKEELQLLSEALKAEQAETQELRARSCSLEDALREQRRAVDALTSEKEEISFALAQSEREMAALARENGSLRDTNAVLEREKLSLLRESESCLRRAEEKEQRLSELADQHARERLALLQRCEEASQTLRDLGEEKAHLESLLGQSRSACQLQQTELEQLKGRAARERQAHAAELAQAEERHERLRLELVARLAELQGPPGSGPSGFKSEVLVLTGAQPLRAARDAGPGHPSPELTPRGQSHEGSPGRASTGEAAVLHMDLEEEDVSPQRADGQLGATVIEMELEPEGPLERKEEPRPALVQPAIGLGSESAATQELAASPSGENELLQQALGQLARLEQVCEGLRGQKSRLLAELDDVRAQCMAATSTLAEEVEELVLEARGLNQSPGLLPTQEEGLRAELNATPRGPPSPKDACDQGPEAEVRRHFSELQEKLFSLQHEHQLLHDQRCQVSARVAELQRYVGTLQADSPVLRGRLVEKVAEDPGDGSFLSLSSSCVTDSPGLPQVGESFYRDPEPAGEETSFSLLGGSGLASPREDSLPVATGLEGLEARCRELEESLESQGAAKDKTIEELEQLLGAERRRHLSESERWQQRLASLTADMESRLAEERRHTERLALELEAAQLQMQGLDLGSRSLLAPELEEALRVSNEGQQPTESEDAYQGAEENARPPGTGQKEENPPPPSGGPQLGESSGEAPGEGRARGPSQPPSPARPALVSADSPELQDALQHLQQQLSQSMSERAELARALEERECVVQGLLQQLRSLEETPSRHWEPETSPSQGAEGDIADPGDNLDVDTDGSCRAMVADCACRERVLEEELEGLRSQCGQAEGRVLPMEANLAHMQVKKLRLTKDNEDKLRLITCLEEQRAAFMAERNCQLGQGEACCEGDGERDQKELPGAPEAQSPSAGCTEMLKDSPEDGGVQAGQGKSECQAQALEVALAERASAATRLGCAQDELRQLRRGMERLRERIEADEQQRRRAREQLRQSERRGDMLQDRVESLERELQLAEEGQERAILDAEQAQAEAEALRVQVAGLATLAQQLQEARGQVAEVEAQRGSLESLLEEARRVKAQLEEEVRAAAEDLNKLQEEVAALCAGWDSPGAAGECPEEPRPEQKPEPGLGLFGESLARLRTWLRANQQEQCQVWARLRDGEHQAGQLQERVASLERELEAATSHRERLAHEAKCFQADAATAAAKLEDTKQCVESLREELASSRSEQEALSADLREQRERTSDLEGQLREQARCSHAAHTTADTLRARLAELDAEVTSLRQSREATEVCLGAQVAALEGQKTELLSRLEDGERRLAEQEEAARVQAQDHRQLVAQLAQAEARAEQEAERAGQLQALQNAMDSQQKALGDLQEELAAARADNVALEEQVSTLVAKDAELQKAWQEREEKLCGEKERLAQELRAVSEEAQSCRGQVEVLSLENEELRVSLDGAGRAQEEAAQYQRRLLDAERQHELDMQTCHEKLASREEQLSAQTAELERLKGSEETLRQALEATTNNLEELRKKAQMDQRRCSEQLKQESARAQGKMKLLIQTCKQLEGEKEALQKELARLEATEETRPAGAVAGESLEALQAEVQELREALEEKGREADEYLDKYCTLLIGHEKLEKAKEMLETQVARLRAQPARQPPGPAPSPLGQGQPDKGPGKRPRVSGTGSPATPAAFPKKSRRMPPSAPGPHGEPEDPEYEPEGLPEVVRKGFTDIPSGKTSPYVLRRTTMATRTSPRLAAQRAALCVPSLDKENLVGTPKASTRGTKPPKAMVAQLSPEEPGTNMLIAPTRRNLPEPTSADSPQEGLQTRRGWLAPSPEAPVEPQSGENCRVQ
ncbi:centromere protein F [Sorex fumeus]|uniref:centromere protein F n=1 Tax=Sorex fumeus TaxID=62283 RepID=UPI0024AE57F1|nr:centromere protein F [Sorex fumeus]